MLPIVNVNATDPQPLPSKDDDALLLFSPSPYVDVCVHSRHSYASLGRAH